MLKMTIQAPKKIVIAVKEIIWGFKKLYERSDGLYEGSEEFLNDRNNAFECPKILYEHLKNSTSS